MRNPLIILKTTEVHFIPWSPQNTSRLFLVSLSILHKEYYINNNSLFVNTWWFGHHCFPWSCSGFWRDHVSQRDASMNFKIKILFSLRACAKSWIGFFFSVAVVLSLLFRVRTRKNESLLIFSKNKGTLTNYWPLSLETIQSMCLWAGRWVLSEKMSVLPLSSLHSLLFQFKAASVWAVITPLMLLTLTLKVMITVFLYMHSMNSGR